MSKLTGVELIAAERKRQIEVEGWTAEHDDGHNGGEMIAAAAAYIQQQRLGMPITEKCCLPNVWPSSWHIRWWKPSSDPIRNLVKAGALIAAELDRLQRLTTSRKG